MIEGNVPDFRFSATFRIFGTALDVEAITAALGVSPTFTCRAGELDRRGKPYERSTWQYTAPVSQTQTLDRHVLALWAALGASKSVIDHLKCQFSLDVMCWFHSNLDWSDFVMSPQCLAALAAFELPVEWSTMVLAD